MILEQKLFLPALKILEQKVIVTCLVDFRANYFSFDGAVSFSLGRTDLNDFRLCDFLIFDDAILKGISFKTEVKKKYLRLNHTQL